MKRIANEWRYFDEVLNMPYPWYTKPALEWLECVTLKKKKIWEYGAGDSTKWYKASGANVKGVDSNREWVPKGFEFKILNPEYPEAIKGRGKFDIIVIDGIWRDECTQFALKELKKNGILIIDNYKQASVEPNIWTNTEKLINGMDIELFKEPNHTDWVTAVVRP